MRTHSAQLTPSTCSHRFTEKTDIKSCQSRWNGQVAIDAHCKPSILARILILAERRPLLECFPAMLSQLPAELQSAAVAVAPVAFTGQAAEFRVQLADCTLPQPKSRALDPGQTSTYSLMYRWVSPSNVGSDAV